MVEMMEQSAPVQRERPAKIHQELPIGEMRNQVKNVQIAQHLPDEGTDLRTEMKNLVELLAQNPTVIDVFIADQRNPQQQVSWEDQAKRLDQRP